MKKPRDEKGRFTFKKNEYNLTGEYGICYTSHGEFIFDLEDYDKIKNYYWDINPVTNYVCTGKYNGGCPFQFLHNFLMNSKSIDHINRNKLDNRKQNLRPATRGENSRNQSKHKNNSSGFTGVYYDFNHCSLWVAKIQYNKKKIKIKSSKDIEVALRYRLQAEYDLFGPEWAPQRHLFEQYNIPDSELHQYLLDKGKLNCLKEQE